MDQTNLSDGGEEVLSGRWRIISSTLEKDEVQIAVSLSLSKMLMEEKKNKMVSTAQSTPMVCCMNHDATAQFLLSFVKTYLLKEILRLCCSRKVWILIL